MNQKHILNLCLFGEEDDIPTEDGAAAPISETDGSSIDDPVGAVPSDGGIEPAVNAQTEGEKKENKCSESVLTDADIEETSRTLLARAHLADLERQAKAMRADFPDFDLVFEMKNPVFARMTAADVGISVEDAYYAVHRKELREAAMREAAEKTAAKLASAIRSGSRRPIESGVSAQAPSVSTFDYAKACRSQREAFKKDLRARMARGEKVYPRG